VLQPTLLIKCMKIDVFYLRVICTCDRAIARGVPVVPGTPI